MSGTVSRSIGPMVLVPVGVAAWIAAPHLPWGLGAIVAACAVTLAPGFALLGCLVERPRPRAAHLALATLLGFASFSLAAFWWTRAVAWNDLAILLSSLTPILAATVIRAQSPPDGDLPPLGLGARGDALLALLVLAVTLLVAAPFILHGQPTADGGRHWFYMGHDWFKHLQVYRGLTHESAIPIANPFVATAQTFRYYLGFYIPAAAVAKRAALDGLLAEQWILFAHALALPAVVAILLARLAHAFGSAPRGILWSVALGGVLGIGLDAIPALGQHLLAHRSAGEPLSLAAFLDRLPDINWWASRRQEQIIASFMWVPQHVASMASVLGVWLVAWNPMRAPTLPRRAVIAILAAGAVFQSVYVGVTAAFLLAVWTIFSWRDPGTRASAGDLLGGALGALAIGFPVLYYYLCARGGYSGLSLAWPRPLNPQDGAIFFRLLRNRIGALLDLPLNYALEFGPHLLLGGAYLLSRRARARPFARPLAWVIALGLLFVTFVVPSGYNNIYSRGGTLLCLLLAVPAGAWLADRDAGGGPAARAIGLLLAATALAGSLLLGAGMWRFTRTHTIDPTTSAALEWIRTETPSRTRLIFTNEPRSFRHAIAYFAWRPFVVSDDLHEKIFIADTTEVRGLHERIDEAVAGIADGALRRERLPSGPIAMLAGPRAAVTSADSLRRLVPGAISPPGKARERVVLLPEK